MKTQDYIRKYKLNLSDKFNHREFVSDLANDFIVLLELNKAENNIKGFDNSLRAIKMKWDAINNKTVGQLPEGLWKYFFATVVVKLRNDLCPKEMKRRKEISDEKKKQWEQRKKQEQWEQEQFSSSWDRYNTFLGSLFRREAAPLESFKQLGFDNESTTIEEINKSYRKLSLKHHPDKGGKQEDFISITESKNKCIQWLNSKK